MSFETTLERIALAVERQTELLQTTFATLLAELKADGNLSNTSSVTNTNAQPASTKPAALPGKVASRPNGVAAAAKPPAQDGLGTEAAHAAAPTFEEARTALINVKTKYGPEVSRTIMKAVGVASATEIKPEDFARVIEMCTEKLAASA